MTPLYIPPSSFWVQPVLAVVDELPQFVKEPTEVAEILVTPLSNCLLQGKSGPQNALQVGGARSCRRAATWGRVCCGVPPP